VEITKFTPPKIVKDEEVKEDDEIKEVEKLEDTKIGSINQEGAKDDGIVAPPVESGTGVVEAPKVEEDYDKVFTVVQIAAEFPGGLPAWAKYLERNLNRDLPVENGAPPGKYTVIVSFIVSKDGSISDVVAENDPGYGTKAEAVRVITKGPKWKPAVQNGRNVIYRHKQSITFLVSEE
jgi:protein TonB